ncbi:helix-turn-helix domain-containing protein [Kribbella sp. NPDC051770]|uniref:IclR family transcriptional regulator n=1 Tax=Kribbella sp. NPDC051770 TaxID=3155413 RepID=UPI0034413D5A
MTSDSGSVESPRAAAVKVLDVLVALSEHGGSHRIVDLAARTDLPKATVYRLLQHLVGQGFAVAEPDSTYRIGPRFLGIAAATLADAPWRKVVRAALESLRTSTGLSAHFAQPYGDQLVVVDAAESLDPFGIPVRPGLTTAMEQTAFGQAIFSRAADAVVRLDGGQLRSVAAPVFHRNGEVLGALGVAGTEFTLADQASERIRALVQSAAADASAVLTAPSFGHRTA